MSLSLMAIMRDDPDFGERLSKKTAAIKADKQGILNAADQYGSQYQEEIMKGTELRAKLLTEGASQGKTEDEIMASYGRFVPTVYTPIINMLYFMLRESEPQDARKYRQRDVINEVLIKTKQLNHDGKEPDISKEELLALLDDKLKEMHLESMADIVRQETNARFAAEEREKAQLKESPEMIEYLYGNLSLDDFNRVKKLKALAQSPNDEEAFLAFKKCRELCKQFGLDYDRIPCYVQKRK